MFGNFLETSMNSSNVMAPVLLSEHWAMIVSAFLETSASVFAKWFAFSIFTSSRCVIRPVLSTSNRLKLKLILSSFPAPTKFARAIKNSLASMRPDRL